MDVKTRLVSVVLVAGTGTATLASASTFEGLWIGAFRESRDWVFVQAKFGGEGEALAGRIDIPELGEDDILLQDVEESGHHLSFDLPAADGRIRFRGVLNASGHVVGSVQHGTAAGTFELIRTRTLSPEWLAWLSGDYEGDSPTDVVLVYARPGGLAYVDYRTRRIGQLYPTATDQFVSGDAVLSGFPVHLEASFTRDGDGRVVELTWRRRGETLRRLRPRGYYHLEEHQVASADGTVLGGSVLLPDNAPPHPAVVLIPGSGKVTRENLMPYADLFARNGVAVVIHDKRGTGRSGGDYGRAGIHVLADDAVAWVNMIRRHPAIDSRKVGVLGASLGAWVAPLVAGQAAVSFVVVEAASTTTPAAHERARVRSQMTADGQPQQLIAAAIAYMDRKFEVGRTGEGWDELQRHAEQGVVQGWIRYVNRPVSLESLRWNWEHVLSYDPQPALRQLRVPVLAIYGGLDRVVDPRSNAKRMQQALREAGNTAVTVRVFPTANHFFFSALTGGPAEIPRLKGFVEGYLESRVDWVLTQVRGAGA